jgi:hypothetical protein
MAKLTIDWSTAEVRDRELAVELSEPPSAKWRKRAKGTLGVLQRPGQPWGEVTLKKRRIVVGAVAEGCEDDVRHHLESVVLQANAGEPHPAQRPDDADTRMTTAFQAFGEADWITHGG